MKVEVTLTSDEYAALSTAPGRSAQQRLKWLVKFWQATKAEHDKRTAPKESEAATKLNAMFKQAADDGVLPATVEDLIERPEHWQEKIDDLADYVAGKEVVSA